MNKRRTELDFLRGIAILLVLLRHENLSLITTQIGWIGVDLFFVLSGFLVSGILFKEFKKNNTVKPFLFLIRRGFKIYPLFFTVLILHILYYTNKGLIISSDLILPEVFFFQNYKLGLLGISWSLAIEEHFYILLSIGLFFAYRSGKINNKNTIPSICIFIAISCLLLRIITLLISGDATSLNYFFYTHFRIDSLAFGVLISWLSYFAPSSLDNFVRNNKYLLIGILPILFSPVFIWQPQSAIVVTIGFSFLYIGFGIVLLLLTTYKDKIENNLAALHLSGIYRVIAWIGIYSYAIYLIHLKAGQGLSNAFKKYILPNSPEVLIIFINFLCSIICGFLLSLIVEKPFLRLRDKYFPSR